MGLKVGAAEVAVIGYGFCLSQDLRTSSELPAGWPVSLAICLTPAMQLLTAGESVTAVDSDAGVVGLEEGSEQPMRNSMAPRSANTALRSGRFACDPMRVSLSVTRVSSISRR